MEKKVAKCTGVTANGYKCSMKQSCKRWLDYSLDDDVYEPILAAPSCIEHTPLECPMKIEAHKE